jgi:hypothetical protein
VIALLVALVFVALCVLALARARGNTRIRRSLRRGNTRLEIHEGGRAARLYVEPPHRPNWLKLALTGSTRP